MLDECAAQRPFKRFMQSFAHIGYGNGDINMSILYRRFMLIAAFIAAMAALTANLILETRRAPSAPRIFTPFILYGDACTNRKNFVITNQHSGLKIQTLS